MHRYMTLVVGLAVLLGLVIGGCSPAATPTEPPQPGPTEAATATQAAPTKTPAAPADGGTLVWVRSFIAEGPYNAAVSTGMEAEICGALFDTLVMQQPDGTLAPGALTESWETSDDGLAYTFHLKKGITFHDGTPFDSEAVRFWIEEMKKGPSGYMFSQVEAVETPDGYTAVFEVSQPFPNLLWNLATYYSGVFSPTAYQQAGEDFGTEVIVGTGPYVLVKFEPGEFILEKNPDYAWAPASQPRQEGVLYPDELIFREVVEDSTRVMMIQSGDAHIVDIPAQYIEQVDAGADTHVTQGLRSTIRYVGMNAARWPFDDLRVRRAVAQAIDREAIIRSLYFDAALPSYSYLPPGMKEAEGAEDYGYHYNPEAARAKLAEAGWADTDGDGIVEKDGKPLHVRLFSRTITLDQHVSEAVQAYLRDIGIDAEIQLVDKLQPVQESGDWEAQVYLSTWANADILDWWFNPDYVPYPNFMGWEDEQTRDMLAATVNAPTWDERVEAFAALNEYLTTQALWAPILTPMRNFALSDSVRGFEVNSFEPMFMTMSIWLEQ